MHFPTDDGLVKSVDGLSFALERGKTLGIVGESGSGKSVTSLAIMGLHKRDSAKITGEIRLDGKDLVASSAEEVRRLRGKRMAMIFQDPLSAMHPYYTVGNQIIEAYRVHNDVSNKKAPQRTPSRCSTGSASRSRTAACDAYPHQFSGGMRQRAMIAMALSCDPDLLIADEPTTALDVTVQAQILDLIRDLQKEFDSAVIIITHDLGRGRRARRRHPGDVRRPRDRVRHRASRSSTSPSTPTPGACWARCRASTGTAADRLLPIKGTPPSLINVPPGCAFNPRCRFADEHRRARPATERPELLRRRAGPPGAPATCPPAQRQQIWRDEIQPLL